MSSNSPWGNLGVNLGLHPLLRYRNIGIAPRRAGYFTMTGPVRGLTEYHHVRDRPLTGNVVQPLTD